MEDYLIVVDQDHLDQRAMRTNPLSSVYAKAEELEQVQMAEAQMAERSLDDNILNRRAAALQDLVRTVLEVPSPIEPNLGYLAVRLLSFDYLRHDHAVPKTDHDIEVLEGIGSVIVRNCRHSLDALNDIPGLTVVRNQEVLLAEPLRSATSKSAEPAESFLASEDQYWHLRKVGLEPGNSGGKGVVVGMIDTGIDPEHPEFKGKCIHFQRFNTRGERVKLPKQDSEGHGTQVASLAVGNTLGTAPDADIAVASVHRSRFDARGITGYVCQLAAGLNWLMTEPFVEGRLGAHVINCSLTIRKEREGLRPAIQLGLKRNILCIAAIGNNGAHREGNQGSPADYPETLSVGATDHKDEVIQISDYRNFNPYRRDPAALPDISAPGRNIYVAEARGGYVKVEGTSLAAPIVTGIAARRMSEDPSLANDANKLRKSLLSKSTPAKKNGINENTGGVGRIIA